MASSLASLYGIVEINEHFRNSPRQLRTDIDADHCLDRAAGLHQSRDTAAFDRGSEEGRDRAFLAVGVAQPDYQRTKQTRHNYEAHVAIILSQPFAVLLEASTHASTLERVGQFKPNVSRDSARCRTHPRYGTCVVTFKHATSY